MPITTFTTPGFVAVGGDDQNNSQQIPPLDVKVSAGEFLDAKELAARFVKLALGTTDETKIADFLRQSGFELKNPPARTTGADGENFYRFEPDAKFQKSIESFKQTGKAVRLGDAPATEIANTGKIPSSPQIKQPNVPPAVPPTVRRPLAPIIKQPQVFTNGTPQRSDFNPADWHRVELSPADFVELARGKKVKRAAQVTVADGDPRMEMYQAALAKLYGGKFSPDVVAKMLAGRTDDTSVFYVGTNDAQSKEAVVQSLTAALKSGKPYNFYISKESTERLLRAEIETHGSPQDKLNLQISDSLAAIDAKFDKIEPQNLLHQAVLAMEKESEKKAAIEALTAASNIDFRQNGTEAEKSANYTADVIEGVARTLIESNPLYAALPKPVKDEMVKGTVGFVRGGYSLYQTAKGINDFVNDGLTDSALSVLKSTGLDKQIGIDTDQTQQALNARRASEAEYARAFSQMGTAEMSKGDAAYGYKQAAGLSIKPYDMPNWAAKGGELTAKALPYIAVGIATGGVGAAVGGGGRALLAEIGISAISTGAMGTGENYSLKREYLPAIKAGAMSAAQGAVAPLSNRLGLGGDLAANTVYSVALGKLEGKSDNEIFQDTVLQNALGAGMQAGSKAHEAIAAKLGKPEFTRAEAQTALKDIFREEVGRVAGEQMQQAVRQIEVETVAQQIEQTGSLSPKTRAKTTTFGEGISAKAAELQQGANKLRARVTTAREEIVANWGKDNKLVTREQYEAASRRIQNRLRTPEGVEYRNSGVPLNNLPDIGIKAAFHFEAARGGFKEFITAMKPEMTAVGRVASMAEYEELYRTKAAQAGVKPSEIEIAKAKLTERTDAELKADLDPMVRTGETQKQAQTRVENARSEIVDRGKIDLYESLGATPKRINIAANDSQYAQFDKAHTDELHGASVALRQTDAPAGTRTIEGRIYGDAPWGKAENYSYKWLDKSTMNQTINEYIQKNWNQIREDLVFGNRHEHKTTFDAGKAVGEGFYNKNQMGMGVRQAEYGKTSTVTIVITLDQIEPPSPIVVTAYPNGKGDMK